MGLLDGRRERKAAEAQAREAQRDAERAKLDEKLTAWETGALASSLCSIAVLYDIGDGIGFSSMGVMSAFSGEFEDLSDLQQATSQWALLEAITTVGHSTALLTLQEDRIDTSAIDEPSSFTRLYAAGLIYGRSFTTVSRGEHAINSLRGRPQEILEVTLWREDAIGLTSVCCGLGARVVSPTEEFRAAFDRVFERERSVNSAMRRSGSDSDEFTACITTFAAGASANHVRQFDWIKAMPLTIPTSDE